MGCHGIYFGVSTSTGWLATVYWSLCPCYGHQVVAISTLSCRADAVTDLDEGAAPSDPTQGPAEGQAEGGPQAGQEAGAEQREAEDPSAFLRQDGEAADPYARRIFERVYGHDIERVLRMEASLTSV